ncbi:gephyrin-like molybdotransferase Glp [Azonexus sp.]|uniref:molybdopterin molybdotransferase MoeA n=1 Tax=Azonexus sp. TaxID=1872668 RepID=UPI0039E5B0F0
MLSFQEALEQLLAAAQPVEEIRHLPLMAARGRVLAEAQQATIDVPPADNSAMDGYAVRAADITAAGLTLPLSQRIIAGSVGEPLQPGTAARIFTGAPIPAGVDAVIMQERCTQEGEGVRINVMPRLGDNIRRQGEDMARGCDILPAGCRLRAQEIALAAAAGLPSLPVYRRLRVGMFFTGNELITPGEPLPPGGIYDSNRYALHALLDAMGCEVRDLGVIPDSLEATRAALREAAENNDLVLTSGGVSVGEEDHVKPAMEAEGTLNLWKIAIKPGKPLAFGQLKGARPAWFIGLPGNPVAAFVTFLMLVRPFILRLQGVHDVTPKTLSLPAAFTWSRPDARLEFLRARITQSGSVAIYPNQGSGVLTSLCWGDGLVLNPPQHTVAAGDLVQFVSFSELMGCA